MKIGSVITAAGCSERMGRFKLTLEIQGKTVIEYTLSGVYNIADEIVVVGGCRVEELRKVLSSYKKVWLVENPNYKLGMFTSVKKGLSEIEGDYIFITPGDCPLIGESIYRLLLEKKDSIVVPSYNRRGGHPVLINAYMKELLLKEPDSSNLKEFMKKHDVKYVEVDSDEILIDMDRPEDFEKIKERITNG